MIVGGCCVGLFKFVGQVIYLDFVLLLVIGNLEMLLCLWRMF